MNPKLPGTIVPLFKPCWLPTTLAVALVVFTLGSLSNANAAEAVALTGPWMHQDIGAVEVAGDATVVHDVFTIKGSLDIWGKEDGFHFVYQPFVGDGEIVACVTAVQNTQNHAKAGIMIREDLTPSAREVSAVVTATDGVQFLRRLETGGLSTSAKLGLDKGVFPYWVKLERKGDTFNGYESADGKEWKLTGTDTVKMGNRVFIGLIASSHVKTVLNTSTLDHVHVAGGGTVPKKP
jgi:regulation of enolase protein 1 (concanavalin A-like superfamily)